MDDTPTGPRLRAARERVGITAAELARQSGINQATISRVERGMQRPSVDTLSALACALDVPLDDLAGCDGPRLVGVADSPEAAAEIVDDPRQPDGARRVADTTGRVWQDDEEQAG